MFGYTPLLSKTLDTPQTVANPFVWSPYGPLRDRVDFTTTFLKKKKEKKSALHPCSFTSELQIIRCSTQGKKSFKFRHLGSSLWFCAGIFNPNPTHSLLPPWHGSWIKSSKIFTGFIGENETYKGMTLWRWFLMLCYGTGTFYGLTFFICRKKVNDWF